ncbi:MAG: ABC transporter ATP-binding protein [Sneathiellaceae bacterium]
MTDAPVLLVEGLQKRFGGLQALGGVDLAVQPREIRAIIGPNGAGKSTFFNTLTGLLQPDAGRVLFEGRDITGRPPHILTRLGIARTFQITSIFPDLTVLQNVQVALAGYRGETWRMWRPAARSGVERSNSMLELVGLAQQGGRPAGTLAHGDQKRLELAIALAGEPRLLLLDEPTAGMTAQERLEAINLVHRVAVELGLTVVFTEHDMAVVFAVATRICVLHQGRLLADGTPEEVRADRQVQEVYLGDSLEADGAEP